MYCPNLLQTEINSGECRKSQTNSLHVISAISDLDFIRIDQLITKLAVIMQPPIDSRLPSLEGYSKR